MRVSSASVQGRRPAQEDRHVAVKMERGWLLAVFDGHRGTEAAEVVCRFAESDLTDAFTVTPESPVALRATVAALARRTRFMHSGTTASLVFVAADGASACWAVVGDSPVALCAAQNRLIFSATHNARDNPRERAAALARGAIYEAGYLMDPELPHTGLAMSRALGNADLSRVISQEPEIQSAALDHQSFLLVGSDGLFTSPGRLDQQMAHWLGRIQQGAEAEQVVAEALTQGSEDNVTAVVWRAS